MNTEPVRVLVVEDSATQAEEVRLVLESGGFEVETAPTAEAGLECLERASFDLAISDVIMPGLSGYEFCRRVKGDVPWKALPVLLLTSLREPIDIIHALECGADGFLSKPCEPERLISRVTTLLESRRLHSLTPGASGIDVHFAGKRFSIRSSKEQILNLLVSTFEDVARKNDEVTTARDVLAEKHEQLLRAEQQKEELAALVVHDLKSPAAGIMMAARSQLKSTSLSEGDRALWGLVYASAESINRMVLNLLEVAGSADGVFAPRPVMVDVPELMGEIRQLMTPVADTLRQEIRMQVQPGVPRLRADPDLLRRVLQNLVDNAMRYSPPGSVVLVEADATGGGVCFRVRDRGPGIPVALRERVFDKYVRIARTEAKQRTSGKGLGLAFCRIAVEAHRGRIWVEDNQPHGSVFVVQLPSE
jgi:two-component system, sensor histidine kinase and response regulator